ncbi:iron-sulfur cluster scaffold-like protein [Amylibacter marinus]|uniref:Iron-sulfur cluster scaffold-like protein n=1 Tax=Amylibacter marinus TaxID=1475483 RepID=A0ABQ5VSS8_9RHOB|nr:iron-sulfur cluster assembly scaffold protein [Amylibacter marinus]GLQ34278.1 iron-sulfur cluster scaffold-like protein [Amylibacter marinus]
MSDNSDMIKLYSGKILALASDIELTEPLAHPDGCAKRRSPLCGSNISVCIEIEDGKVKQFQQDVKACALGQASASILEKAVIGQSQETIQRGRDQLFAMLAQDGPSPEAPFAQLSLLEPAKEYRNRHASILLGFDATLEAFETAAQKKRA